MTLQISKLMLVMVRKDFYSETKETEKLLTLILIISMKIIQPDMKKFKAKNTNK